MLVYKTVLQAHRVSTAFMDLVQWAAIAEVMDPDNRGVTSLDCTIKMISLKNLNHKSKFAVWTISYHAIMLEITYSVKMNITCMYFYNCITFFVDELCGLLWRTACYEYGYLFTAIFYQYK